MDPSMHSTSSLVVHLSIMTLFNQQRCGQKRMCYKVVNHTTKKSHKQATPPLMWLIKTGWNITINEIGIPV